MKPISQPIYEEMKQLGLLEPEVVRDENGNTVYIRDRESGRKKKEIIKKCQISNRNKNSKAKTYFVEEPIYKQYLKIKSK